MKEEDKSFTSFLFPSIFVWPPNHPFSLLQQVVQNAPPEEDLPRGKTRDEVGSGCKGRTLLECKRKQDKHGEIKGIR